MEAPPNRPRQPSSHGYRLPVVEARHPGYEPTDPPPSIPEAPRAPSSFERASQLPLARLLTLIAAAATGVAGIITALGAAIVNIIHEARPSMEATEIRKEIEAIKLRADGDFGLGQERTTRQEKDAELKKAVDAATTKAAACDGIAERVQKLEDAKGGHR